ncbi:DUF2795 domain-containing protein [Natranaeroarchaeum aerophilus]|uniref:DUF2795 domain-containing protein n=2 Tax=Natranaeroarchaeum aerophilus TaxID=2917711 RepID=A0AAE3K530_9EURY|nr:DUF2795 domain-containing protein [Natranaeroarchaeum aerophilus]MCL9813641.1 DUF2795 domain-containing protein [Natranaeroarchaeum aerophilus]
MNNTTELFTDAEFPITSDELLDRYGDEEIDLSNETLREVLERTGPETYENREDAEFAVYSGVSDRAIGRKGYSDRDPTPLGSPHGPDQYSF